MPGVWTTTFGRSDGGDPPDAAQLLHLPALAHNIKNGTHPGTADFAAVGHLSDAPHCIGSPSPAAHTRGSRDHPGSTARWSVDDPNWRATRTRSRTEPRRFGLRAEGSPYRRADDREGMSVSSQGRSTTRRASCSQGLGVLPLAPAQRVPPDMRAWPSTSSPAISRTRLCSTPDRAA